MNMNPRGRFCQTDGSRGHGAGGSESGKRCPLHPDCASRTWFTQFSQFDSMLMPVFSRGDRRGALVQHTQKMKAVANLKAVVVTGNQSNRFLGQHL